jgi:hypothetical protein
MITIKKIKKEKIDTMEINILNVMLVVKFVILALIFQNA